LIAVFVDHPDKWTSSSWAWAAGLMTVFLIMMLCICSAFWPAPNTKSVPTHRGSPRNVARSVPKESWEKRSAQSASSPRALDNTRSSTGRITTSSSQRRDTSRVLPVPKPTEFWANLLLS
jgi:hypothetical protein